MSVKEYNVSLETNAMILGMVALNMKNFAFRSFSLSMVAGCLDDAGLAALKEKCVRILQLRVCLWNKRQRP
jgi:hypothetical protein